jgi:hypothetical protein
MALFDKTHELINRQSQDTKHQVRHHFGMPPEVVQ